MIIVADRKSKSFALSVRALLEARTTRINVANAPDKDGALFAFGALGPFRLFRLFLLHDFSFPQRSNSENFPHKQKTSRTFGITKKLC